MFFCSVVEREGVCVSWRVCLSGSDTSPINDAGLGLGGVARVCESIWMTSGESGGCCKKVIFRGGFFFEEV